MTTSLAIVNSTCLLTRLPWVKSLDTIQVSPPLGLSRGHSEVISQVAFSSGV